MNRSLDLSSKEFTENNRRLEEVRLKVEKQAQNLALQVAERTENLNERVAELENVRKAMANLLEDLGEEKKKSETLAEELKKFKLAVDNASDNIVITDPEGLVIYANRAVEETTGYKPEEAVGKKSGLLWKTPMPPEYYRNLWDIIKTQKKTFVGEIQNKRKNGEIYTAAVSISPVLDAQGRIIYFVGIERDVTKEREADRAKSEFISIASHQLRTPLTGIQWVVERFMKKEKLTPKGKEYLDDIHMSAKRLTELVDLLLNLSRIEGGKIGITPEPTEVAGIVKSYLQEAAGLCDKKELKVVFEDCPAELTVKTDKNALRNIVQNIIGNAIEYTPQRGKITVAIQKKDDGFIIKVNDTGIGIPKAEQAHVFQKFVRASNAKLLKANGTGIGLYIAERAANLLGGKIWFESEENRGSTFYVELPLEFKPKREPQSVAA